MPMAASASTSCTLPVSTNSFICPPHPSVIHNGVTQRSDALHLYHDPVAGFQRSHARRRACRDDVTGVQRHDERCELDELIDAENQLLRARRLSSLAVDPTFDAQCGTVEADGDARAEWRERVEPFCAGVLHVPLFAV